MCSSGVEAYSKYNGFPKHTPETAIAASTRDAAVAIQLEKEGDATSATLKESDSLDVENGSTTSHERRPGTQVPLHASFDFSHDHLREWGYAYLGNITTADVFINAVSLRRPSLALMKEEKVDKNSSSNLVTIRARVLPKEKERKPFLIQKELDVEELRRCIPLTQSAKERPPVVLRRSSRDRRRSTQLCNISLRRGSANAGMGTKSKLSAKTSVPIHIKYALHYLPVLAALMLSGHVKKGDTIDLPVPSPESWSDTIAYIYMGSTSKEGITTCMRDNILHLGGNV